MPFVPHGCSRPVSLQIAGPKPVQSFSLPWISLITIWTILGHTYSLCIKYCRLHQAYTLGSIRCGEAVNLRVFNSLRPRQNRRHFADDVFKCNFMNENVWIPIKISLKFVPEGPINNISALVQIMAWRRIGDKPLSEPMMTQFTDVYMRHSASMS